MFSIILILILISALFFVIKLFLFALKAGWGIIKILLSVIFTPLFIVVIIIYFAGRMFAIW